MNEKNILQKGKLHKNENLRIVSINSKNVIENSTGKYLTIIYVYLSLEVEQEIVFCAP